MLDNLLPYMCIGVIGYLFAKLTTKPIVSPFFQDVVIKNIKLGKKVVICVDNEATMFEMINDKIRITRAAADISAGEVKDDKSSVANSGAIEHLNPSNILQ